MKIKNWTKERTCKDLKEIAEQGGRGCLKRNSMQTKVFSSQILPLYIYRERWPQSIKNIPKEELLVSNEVAVTIIFF